MLDDLLELAKARLGRAGWQDDASEADRLARELAPDDQVVGWVSGRDDDEALLWVATDRRVLLLAQEMGRRAVTVLSYPELHEVWVALERGGAKVRLYATGRKYSLDDAAPDDARRFHAEVERVRGRLT